MGLIDQIHARRYTDRTAVRQLRKNQSIDTLRTLRNGVNYEPKIAVINYSVAVGLSEDDPTTSNTGSPLPLVIQAPGRKRMLIKFDVSSLAGKNIRKAYLRFVNDTPLSGSNGNYWVRLIIRPSARDWTTSATWNTYNGIDPWTTGGGIGAGDRQSDQIIAEVYRVPSNSTPWFIDITTIVNKWKNNTYPNYGLSIGADSVDNDRTYGDGNIKIKDSIAGVEPCLVVEYTDSTDVGHSLTDDQKLYTAFSFLQQRFGGAEWNWQSGGLINAMANAEELGIPMPFRKSLTTFFDNYINSDGSFKSGASITNFNRTAFAEALITLYQRTNITKYRTALQGMRNAYDTMTKINGIYDQGGSIISELAYFGLPFLAKYGDAFNDSTATDIAVTQAILLFDALNQPDNIPLQKYDSSTSKGWARGVGWLYAGFGKLLQYNGVKTHANYNDLVSRYRTLSATLKKYQKDNGLWRNVIQNDATPYETSGTALFVIGMEFGLQEKILDSSYYECQDKAIKALFDYSLTGCDMGQVFPDNLGGGFLFTDFSVSHYGFGLWMEMFTIVLKRATLAY